MTCSFIIIPIIYFVVFWIFAFIIGRLIIGISLAEIVSGIREFFEKNRVRIGYGVIILLVVQIVILAVQFWAGYSC